MSPLAEILHTWGYQLSGSDNNESDNVNRMRSLGIPVTMGHAAANIDGVELVVVGGESDRNARSLDYDWVLDLRAQCIRKNVSFEFRQCGTHFIKDGRRYTLQTRDLCRQARLAGIHYTRKLP